MDPAVAANVRTDHPVIIYKILNIKFVSEHKILSVIEWGCGDGNQLELMRYPKYLGLDVSETIIEACKKRFSSDINRQFQCIDNDFTPEVKYDLSISLDVIYHLVEDDIYEQYMKQLFNSAKRFVCIYALDEDSQQGGYYNHMRHRKFTEYIAKHFKQWKLYRHIPNAYPYDLQDFNNTSFCEFFFYKRKMVGLF